MPNGNQQQQGAPKEPKFVLFDIKALPKHAWNWFWRLPGLRRFRVGRKRALQMPKIWYELEKTWLPKNTSWFNTKLRTIEDIWTAMGTHYGSALVGDHGSLLGNPDGIVAFYEKLGVYSDIERVKIEADWFLTGTGYIEENLKFDILTDRSKRQRLIREYGWDEDKVEEAMQNLDALREQSDKGRGEELKLLKKISLYSGTIYHEGKKEYEEELYCFGYPKAEELANRIALYNRQLNIRGLQIERIYVDVRTKAGEATAALGTLMREIAKIEKETFTYLGAKEGLSGQIATYQQKWNVLVDTLSPERHPGNVVVIRFPHTYRIIKLFATEEVEETIKKDQEVYSHDAEKNEYKKERQYILKKKVPVRLKQDKSIYEEEKEDITKKINELRRADPVKYALRIENYEQRLRDIDNNIGNKQPIIEQTTPKVKVVDYSERHKPGAEFWKRPEELDVGLDENGYPLEIAPDDNTSQGWKKGMVLIDKWWSELADNTWQLKTIAMKPGGREVLKKHLGVDVEYFEGKGDDDDIDKDKVKLRARIVGTPTREIRYIKDERFYGHVDLLELGHIIYSYWDAVRDDFRDGRFHRWSKSVADYVIEGQGGFDEARGAPYLKSWGTIYREKGLLMRRRGIVPPPSKSAAVNVDVNDKNVQIKATPADFEKVPADEKAIKQDFIMRLPDDTNINHQDIVTKDGKKFITGTRRPSKYNPAFDRRAENLDYIHWGRMYYYRWISYPNEWSENPFPHVSTRGIALYIAHLVATDVWNYKDAEDVLEGHSFDYGVRGQGEYGFVNPLKGTGILQEN